jgi:hypothetical protein
VTIQRSDELRPLCPRHSVVMVMTENAEGTVVDTSQATDCDHRWACSVDECSQNYSPSLGHFTIKNNLDFWHVTNSPSIGITRSLTQVLCAHESNNVMFLETFDFQENVQIFRCPHKGCEKTMKIRADGPPACWLVEGFFAEA